MNWRPWIRLHMTLGGAAIGVAVSASTFDALVIVPSVLFFGAIGWWVGAMLAEAES